jgi:Uma2 family endonuclease
MPGKRGFVTMLTQEAPTKTMSVAEFIALPKDGRRYELVEGELIEMAGSNSQHAWISMRIGHYLMVYVEANDWGRVYSSDARYETVSETPTSKATVRMPDVSFVQTSRLPVPEDIYTMPFAPDLAVEVLSESNEYGDMENKVNEYFSKGGRLVWVVNVWRREVYVYRVGKRERETFAATEELDGGDILPGFKLPVQAIFEKVKDATNDRK